MCINLSWNRPGQQCQHDAATDAAFLEQYGEALKEDALSVSSAADDVTEVKDRMGALSMNTELQTKPTTPKPIMRTLTTAAFLFAGLFAIAQTTDAPSAMTLVKEGTLLVDVREPSELAQVAYDAPNVVNIPLGELAERANEIPKDQPVVIACQAGGRSAQAIAELQKLGYTNLVDLDGGLNAWQEAGMPVKKGGAAKAACCAGGKTATNSSPEQAKAGCCSGDKAQTAGCAPGAKAAACCSSGAKAEAPVPTDKKIRKK